MSPQLEFSPSFRSSQTLARNPFFHAPSLAAAPSAFRIASRNALCVSINSAPSLRQNAYASVDFVAQPARRAGLSDVHFVDRIAASKEPSSLERLEFDVVIVGAGIIGLSIANRILTTTKFSVALVDATRPCAGATGAGQGYIWLGHMSPGTLVWPLAKRSKQLWDEFVNKLDEYGIDPLTAVGYRKTGSLLFGSTSEQSLALQDKVEALRKEGVQSEYLLSSAIAEVEPHLKVGAEGCAALTLDDSQIDAQLAALHIAEENRGFALSGRFKEILYDPVVSFLWSDQGSHVRGVQTSRGLIYCKESVIMAAGAWSGGLMENAFQRFSLPFVLPTKPRKGHLLVLEGLSHVFLRHALMECGYGQEFESSNVYGIATTATMDARGQLLLGSSRQFAGFDHNLQYEVIECILKRATKFLPVLGRTHLTAVLRTGTVRIGHRPYVPDGRPFIGRIPGMEGLLLATGHEGAGLCLAPGTAEMITNLISDKGHHAVDPLPFSPAGRLVPPNPEESVVHQC